jgi:hypothetical protein
MHIEIIHYTLLSRGEHHYWDKRKEICLYSTALWTRVKYFVLGAFSVITVWRIWRQLYTQRLIHVKTGAILLRTNTITNLYISPVLTATDTGYLPIKYRGNRIPVLGISSGYPRLPSGDNSTYVTDHLKTTVLLQFSSQQRVILTYTVLIYLRKPVCKSSEQDWDCSSQIFLINLINKVNKFFSKICATVCNLKKRC